MPFTKNLGRFLWILSLFLKNLSVLSLFFKNLLDFLSLMSLAVAVKEIVLHQKSVLNPYQYNANFGRTSINQIETKDLAASKTSPAQLKAACWWL
jgi:hypothetical protein